MSCINIKDKVFVKLADRYGEPIAEYITRGITKEKNQKEFYIPTILEAKEFITRNKAETFSKINYAFKLDSNLKLSAIKEFLKGVISAKDNVFFIVKGLHTNPIQRALNEAEIYRPNLNIIKKLANKYPSIFKIKETSKDLTTIVEITPKQNVTEVKKNTQGKQQSLQFSKLTKEEKSKTIEEVTKQHRSITALKDLSAKLAWRIGGKVSYENRTDVDYKGYSIGNNSVLNEAFFDSSTAVEEILAHPIINTIQKTNSTLYNQLLKELETGTGLEILNRVRRDYDFKQNYNLKPYKENGVIKGYNVSSQKEQSSTFFRDINEAKEFLETKKKIAYTLQEQQNEALAQTLALLGSQKLDELKDKKLISLLRQLWNEFTALVKQLFKKEGVIISDLKLGTSLEDLSKMIGYANNPIILPGYKVEYQTPLGNKYDTLEGVNNEIRGLVDSNVEVDLSDVTLNNLKGIKLPNYFQHEIDRANIYIKDDQWFVESEGDIQKITKEDAIGYYLSSEIDKSETIESNIAYKKSIENFIEKNKEYEQSKEIIEQWKKENNIAYDPEEVYSRGQGFYSSIGAYSNLELDLLFQNLLQHIEDNKKAGGEFTISAFTRLIDSRLKHIEGTEGKVRFKIFPQSQDIKWAAPIDVYSGSVWDATEKVSKDKKSELLGVSYTKTPSLQNVNQVSPNLSDIIDNLFHAHNELGIELTPTNFRIDYDSDINYETKKLIDNINKILNDKYGKVVEPNIGNLKETGKFIAIASDAYGDSNSKLFNTEKEALDYKNSFVEDYDVQVIIKQQTGKQPLKTKENTSSIESVKDRIILNNLITNVEKFTLEDIEYRKKGIGFEKTFYDEMYKYGENRTVEIFQEEYNKAEKDYKAINNIKDEYTSQALINLKIAKLKEVARKYPRSLITSKVVSIDKNLVEDNQEIQFQLNNNLQQSKASKETIEKLKKVIVNKGISLVQLEEYVKQHPEIDATNVNALADTVKGIVALSRGSEKQALTEEFIHIATAIIEQTNSQLITSLISKIDKYKIYKQVFEEYKNNKSYQLENGKPNIRKIKKEAVDKLLAEYIIKQSEGSEQFPELFDLEQRNLVQTMWDTITMYIRQLFNNTQLDFEQTAQMIVDGSFEGDVSDLNSNGDVMFQLKFPLVEELANKLKDMHSRTELIEVSATNEKRHYEVDKKDKMKKTSSSIKKPFTKERTDIEKIQDESKKLGGLAGHSYIENYIKYNLLDENGYALEVFKDTPIETKLSKKLQDILKTKSIELISNYPKGTIFLIETNVHNKSISFGSMIDFVAISPVKDKDENDDIVVDILDWKFIAKKKDDIDVLEQKKNDWKQQMDYYRAIFVRLGVKGKQFKKTQMIPFVSEYAYTAKGDPKSPLVMTNVSVTDFSDYSKTELFMLPVSTLNETSGNNLVDGLIKSLNSSYDKIAQQATTPETAIIKKQKLEKLNEARRKLQGQLNFEPLYEVGKTFLEDVKNTVSNYKTKNFEDLSEREIQLVLKKLEEFQEGAKKFIDLPVIFNDFLLEDKTKRTEEENKQLKSYENVSARTALFMKDVTGLSIRYFEFEAQRVNRFSKEEIEEALKGDKTIGNLDKQFLENSKINSVFFKLASFMYLKAKSKVERLFNIKATEYGSLLQKVSKIASNTGKTAFDLIGVNTEFGPQLLKKYNSEFIKKKNILLKTNNAKELKKLINIDKYDKLLNSTLEKRLKYINEYIYSYDVEENEKTRELFRNITEENLDINNSKFKGGNDNSFKKLFNESLIDKPEILSNGYKNMLQNTEVLDLWNYFTNINKRAYAMGYIKEQGLSFLPLVEASTIQKIKNNGLKGIKDTVTNIYQSDVNEQNTYNSVDMETGLLVNKIPKLFTRTNKEANMLSTDLNKIGLLYIKALDEYEMLSDLEYSLQTLSSVYKTVPEYVTENGLIKFIGDIPVTGQVNVNNAPFFQIVINDFLYKQSENVDSLGNSVINNQFANTEEGQEKASSVKKSLESANTYLRLKALGLAPVTALSNLFGGYMNNIINTGGLYTKTEFTKNILGFQNNKQESLTLKALIDQLVPFAGQSTLEYNQRKIAKGLGYKNYLNSWSFTDAMMTLNSTGEKLLELAHAKTIIENSIVINGQILNARQYLVKQDQGIRNTLSESERMNLEKTLDSRVKELKESDKSLLKLISFDETQGVLNTNNVSGESLDLLRMQIIDLSRNMTGQMSYDDKMGFNRDILAKSAMMFKGWIPKLVSIRGKDITKNVITNEWEIGRYRSVIGLLQKRAFYRVQDIKSVLKGDDRGFAIIDEMYQAKKDKYKRDTGKELTITKEEYQDLIRQNLKNAFTEIKLIVGLATLLLLANLSAPDDDDDPQDKSMHKLLVKQLNRIKEELTFFVNPVSADEITRGSIIPAFGVLKDVITILEKVIKEGIYVANSNEDKADKNYVNTAIIKRIPGANQFQQVIVPFLFPEYAKENGIKIESDFRR